MTQTFDRPVLHLKTVAQRVMSGQFDFDLFDHHDQVLATIREPKQHLWKTVFRNVVGQEYSAKHFMHADGADGEPLFAIDKHNEIRGASAAILLPNAGVIGGVNKVNWNRAKPHFQVVDEQGALVADVPVVPVRMASFTWNFRVLDPRGVEMAEILQSDPGSLLSAPDLRGDYTLRLKYKFDDPMRILLLATFVTIAWFREEAFAD